MPELLLVVGVMAVLLTVSYPFISNIAASNAFAEADAKANVLSVGKVLFYKDDPDAEEKWDAAKSANSQFSLIKPYVYGAGDVSNLTHFISAPSGYDIVLGVDVRDPVKLVASDGNNGHANNEDGVDVSNPGQGGGGPNGEVDQSGEVDDEIKKGGNG